MTLKTIFGYGSLLDPVSLKATAPHASTIRPAYIKGFTRSFDLLDPLGWTETNLDLAGQPFCAMDIHPTDDTQTKVNGILFSVPDADLERLLIREQDYQLITTMVYDFTSNQELGECYVFSSGNRDGSYDFPSPAQARYLEIYLAGGKRYGEAFYQMLLDTTCIGGQRLSSMTQLNLNSA